ncbi:hypothetical protein KBB74_02630 [Candidatus Parcubacteria bacterium]|nr:hypothetical protein [Candidatus Parcubacteria bacterium]
MESNELKGLASLNKKKDKDTLAERVLFGQFLVNKGYISYSTLNEAITLQEEEGYNMKIGEVLLRHFGIFKDENDLNDKVQEFYNIRNSIIKERKRENEKYTVKSVIEDVDFFLNQYTEKLDISILDKAILILESEKEYRIERNKTFN